MGMKQEQPRCYFRLRLFSLETEEESELNQFSCSLFLHSFAAVVVEPDRTVSRRTPRQGALTGPTSILKEASYKVKPRVCVKIFDSFQSKHT